MNRTVNDMWHVSFVAGLLRTPCFPAFHRDKKAFYFSAKSLLLCPFLLAGCVTNTESVRSSPFAAPPVQQSRGIDEGISYWDDTASAGKPRILIDLSEQRAYFYRGNKVVGVSVVSTGRAGYATPSGEFSVIEKDPTHASSLYGDYVNRSGEPLMENVDVAKDPQRRGAVFPGAPMPYFLRIHGGIGMHAG